jgi:hypothetical protein
MHAQAKVALDCTKALHRRLGKLDAEADPDEIVALRVLACKANKAVQAVQRIASMQVAQSDVRESILREAVREELIDREANAARVLDRQRLMSECKGGATSVFERAFAMAQQIEANVGTLCPHQVLRAPGISELTRS